MVWINPGAVTFGGETIEHAESVTIDREAVRAVEEFADGGPHVVFADVPAQRVRVRLVRRITEAELGGIVPGDLGELRFRASSNAGDGGSTVTVAQAVVRSVTHALSRSGEARQTIEFVAVSEDGASDPVSESAE